AAHRVWAQTRDPPRVFRAAADAQCPDLASVLCPGGGPTGWPSELLEVEQVRLVSSSYAPTTAAAAAGYGPSMDRDIPGAN
ncbi:hypothetical protein EV182_008335, partial [Spiromyces aspiralis]